MHRVDPVYLAHQLKRWMAPNAHLFVRPDWRRFVRPEDQKSHPFALYERKYSPDQPRVPAGSREGGQWTSGESNSGSASSRNAQYAQNRSRGGSFGGASGSQAEPTPAQAARLTVVEAQARDALARVRELDPRWSPSPSFTETAEGRIAAAQAEAREAEAHLRELANVGIGPGPYAGESIPAGPSVTAADRRELNRIGSETGCNTCGTLDPGTPKGNFVADHQPPTALNLIGLAQRLYPQCLSCSLRQGGWVNQIKRGQ